MAEMPTAMISSTAYDLPKHREAAENACLRVHFFPVMMEHQARGSADALQLSLELVDRADVYVLILGRRYGEVAPGQDKSFTHLEFERAVERRIPTLVMLIADDHPQFFADVETGPGAERLAKLREEVRLRQGVNYFSSPDDLRAKLIFELGEMRNRLQPRQASFHHIRQLVAPPEPYIAHPYTLLQTTEVVGRHQELNALTDWVTGSDPQFNAARILIFVAIGGIGKSAVTWKWFNEIAQHEMRPLAGRVWWSFYESDARFDNFVIRTLAYVTGQTLEQVQQKRAPERVDELLAVLDHEPYLIVLDGLERLLIGYARPDAAHLADDDLDTEIATSAAATQGLPAGAATSFTGQSRLRMAADPRVGDFLLRLAAVRASRVLATSRLFPTDLQTATRVPRKGAAAYFVQGLSNDDAVSLWRAFGVSGSREDLIALFNTFGNYPLLIRALAGEVARYRPAPGDFSTWRQAHADFDPFQFPLLVQRKSHVLQYALSGLSDADNRVLRTIAAFRAPTTYDTLAGLLVGPGRPCADEATLDVVLSDLEDRGLVGWDKRANRYDLHPVVRGVAWSALDPESREGIYQNLASHFEALPEVSDESVRSIDDLAGVAELYHTLIQLNRVKDAFTILNDRIAGAMLEHIGTFRELAEFAEMLATKPELLERLREDDDENPGVLMAMLGICYYLCGDPARALEAFDKIDGSLHRDAYSALLAYRSMILCQIGALAAAGRLARQSVHEEDKRSGEDYLLSIMALATVVIRRGGYEEGDAWLSDYRVIIENAGDDISPILHLICLAECGLAALRRGHLVRAQAVADEIALIAEETGIPQARIQLMIVSAGVAEAQGRHELARDLLNDALVLAREARAIESEAGLLVQLGQWHNQHGAVDAARGYAADALHLAEHAQLKLSQADALNLLSRVHRAGANQLEAAAAAAAAYRLAWCDGPPYAYEWGIRQARENLEAVAEPEPTDLPAFRPGDCTAELGMVPTSLNDALALQPPLNDAILRRIIRQLTGDEGRQALQRGLSDSAWSPEIRAAAIERLRKLDGD
jgi:tetratricopeptide (TPR) repeat protein